MPMPSFSLVIAAAGSSSRFRSGKANGNTKKEFMALEGHSVLYSATIPFFSLPTLKAVAVTYAKELESQTKYALEDIVLQTRVPVLMVEGGGTRQASVLNALAALSENGLGGDFVMIHDGARPFVSVETICEVFGAAAVSGAAAGVIPVSEAVVTLDDEGSIASHVDRSKLFLIQTPQIFLFKRMLDAHIKAAESGLKFVDDASIYARYAGKVSVCPGDERNRKITWPRDIEGRSK